MTRGARKRLLKLAPVVTAVMLFAAGCASREDAPQTTLDPQGPAARKIDNMISPIFVVAIIIGIVIIGAALFVAFKFRARDEDDYNNFPNQVHGNFKLEIGWTIVPMVGLAIVAVFTVALIFDLAKKPEKDAVQVEVYGQQWWWEYRYDLNGDGNFTDIITANDLVIPAGREVSLHIKSRDVIHSWWAPGLNGKKDAVPGRVHPLTIEADKPGEFIGQCTEFCGLSHAEMRIKVVAMTESDYAAWTEHQQKPFVAPTSEDAKAGWAAFAGQCTSCHELAGMTDPADPSKTFEYPKVKNQVSGEAPNLAHLMSRTTFAGGMYDLRRNTPECVALGQNWAQTDDGFEACFDRTALQAWLRDPPAMKYMKPGETPSPESRGMPNFNLSEAQIDQLIAFLSEQK
jgi:cytochrome c oxidase subunit 2